MRRKIQPARRRTRSIRASVTVTISVSRRERPNSITPASSSYVARAIPCSPFGASVGTSTANRLHSHIEGLEGAVSHAFLRGDFCTPEHDELRGLQVVKVAGGDGGKVGPGRYSKHGALRVRSWTKYGRSYRSVSADIFTII